MKIIGLLITLALVTNSALAHHKNINKGCNKKDCNLIIKVILGDCDSSSSSSSSEECPDSCELPTDPPCDPYSCGCTKEYNPVCGSNGVTYANPCVFQCAKQRCYPDIYQIPCPCNPDDCVCTEEYSPVCGSDGVTYDNQCKFECAQKCNPNLYSVTCPCNPWENCFCLEYYAPLCGSNGLTYSNDCYFDCYRTCSPWVYVAYNGECGASTTGPPRETTTMETTTPTETTLSETTLSETTPADTTPSVASKPGGTTCPPCVCQAIFRPVCGSDGKTYDNSCLLACETCRAGFTKAYDGECEKIFWPDDIDAMENGDVKEA